MKAMIYTFRNENAISGEKYTTIFLHNCLKPYYEVVSQREFDLEKIQSFWTFLSVSQYLNLKRISRRNLVDLLIIKIPTASQIFLVPLLTRGFTGKVIVWIDGLMWEFPGIKTSLEFAKKEPLVFFARMIINNKIWSRLSRLFSLTYVVASETQKDQFFHYLRPTSKIHIIPNAVPYAADFVSLRGAKERPKDRKEVNFGYIGHSYPVKGLSDIKKSFEFLHGKGISPKLELALSTRGELTDDVRLSLPNVAYMGMVDRSEFYSRIDCLIFPYWADWGTNTFPSVLLESIELGIPVIISDSSLSRELFTENGAIFYERTNYLDLARVVEKIYLGAMSLPDKALLRMLYDNKLSKENVERKWMSLIND